MTPTGSFVQLSSLTLIFLTGVSGHWNSNFNQNNALLQDQGCGKLQRNGTDGVWPWIAQIYKWSENSGKKYVCAGALISPSFVVTTATCITVITIKYRFTDQIEVIIGSETLGVGEYHQLQNYKIHKNYKITKIYYDVGVLQLQLPLKRTTPICLPVTMVRVGTILTTIGWGLDDYGEPVGRKLATKRRRIISRNICNPRKSKFYYSHGITKDLLCTKPYYDSHISDDGSPLMFFKNGRWILIGVTNWKSSLHGVTTASTSAYHYREWLQKITDCCQKKYPEL